ncbi:MAG: aminotransferase class V-fold PLP-dependent enzyme [Ardenticatenaceae bacterium]|nr:aminotransferase class V-fold PLP-dependent enzyme [Ardenticatenaceae bacterium]
MSDSHLRAVRADVPATEHCAYLNTGTCGPVPRPALAALRAEAEHAFEQGRANIADYDRFKTTVAELRADFARLLGADADEIALTHHTTEGMNIATWGLNWQSGDEVLVTTLEHEGGLIPAYVAARRFGVDVRVADLGRGGDPGAVLAALEAGLTPRTRLLSISHVSWNSGACLPLAEIVALAHRRGVLVAVDGAQSAGAVPLDVHALGVDFYALPGQKWLCGPEGVGALYVRRDRISLLRPTFAGFSSLRDPESCSLSGDFLFADSAKRYEVGTAFRPAIDAMRASLCWLEETVGWEWAFTRVHALADEACTLLGALPGAVIYTPRAHAGLTTFTVAGLDPVAAVEALAAQGIIIRHVPFQGAHALRVSTGFYNTTGELERVRDALAALIS